MGELLTIICGDALTELRKLPSESVQMCCTSPPYWGLRDYGTAAWEGGDEACDHKQGRNGSGRADGIVDERAQRNRDGVGSMGGDCGKCGARRIDSQLGLEKTPEEYVARMVEVFREVRRVLRKDGTLWLNLGDSYHGSWGNSGQRPELDGTTDGQREKNCDYLPRGGWDERRERPASSYKIPGLKAKDLCGIPWAVAKALQQPYYIGRIKSERDRIWLAAIIDAEGSICGFTHKRKDNGEIRRGIHVTITNSNMAILDECFRIWPTTREEHNCHTKGHLGDLQTWRWIAHGMEEKSQLLAELYPYFVGKKKQALLAWNFIEISKQARGRNKGAEGDQNREKSAWIVHALSRLNHLESVDIPPWIKEPPSQFEDGWWLRSDIIWAKPNGMPESTLDRPTRAHEYVFQLTKSERYFYDYEAVRLPPLPSSIERLEQHVESQVGSVRANGGDKTNGTMKAVARRSDKQRGHSRRHDGFNDRWDAMEKEDQQANGAALRSVWWISPAQYAEAHFAVMPRNLAALCILSGSRVGDTILDPFAGSGTTGAVALELGRKAVLIELNPKYVTLIEQRCSVTPGLALA